MLTRASAAILTLAFAAAPGPAPDAAVSAAAVEIDRACASDIDVALRGEPQMFVRIYGAQADGNWRPYEGSAEHRIAHDPDIYSEVARVWREGDSVVLLAVSARSIDIRAEASYCFRREGSLARVMESSSGVEVVDDEQRYFDEHGGLVARSSKFYPLSSHAPATISADFKPSTPLLYMNVRDLPFLHGL